MASSNNTSSYPPVAFIGLGAMGFAMSTHLVRTGFPVTGYDIYAPTLERFEKACSEIPNSQASTATSPAEAVRSAAVVCLMVANHHHVHSALFDEKVGAVHNLPKGVTVIIHATIPPTQPAEVRRRLTEEFGREDVVLIDAPVSGGTARSINGTLTLMVSAAEDRHITEQPAQAVLANLASQGKTLYPIPGGLGNGQSAKALNQVMCGIHIVSASEIMGLAALNSLDTQSFYDRLVSDDSKTESRKNRGWSWMFENRGPRMLSATPPTSSATSIIDKDVGIIRDEEERLGVELPLLNRASEILKTVMKTHASADDSVIAQHYLGMDSPRQNQVVERAGKLMKGGSDEGEKMAEDTLAYAHAMIHLNSAYETTIFAKALKLMGAEQKRMWFKIISGAAGGSTTFSEVIPLALADGVTVEDAFKNYAQRTFPAQTVTNVATIVSDASSQGYRPVLLEAAVKFVQDLIS